ncbi:MAG: sugar nucleotide-binding protein [Akkermansia sp.]
MYRVKLEAEFRVREEMPDALIARVSWVFGNPERPSFQMVLRRAMKREPLAAVADKWSMPTWMEDLLHGSVFWLMRAGRPACCICVSPRSLFPGTVMPWPC